MSLSIAIVGYEEPLAEQLLSQLEDTGITLSDIHLLTAIEQDEEQSARFQNKTIYVKPVDVFDWQSVDLVYLVGNAPEYNDALQDNLTFIYKLVDLRLSANKDKTLPIFASEEDVPAHVACADDLTAVLAKIIQPLFEETAIQHLNVVAIKPVSETLPRGPEVLAREISQLMNGRPLESEGAQNAFNLIPLSDENPLFGELKQIFPQENIQGAVTSIQASVFYGTTAIVDLILEDALPKEMLKNLLTANQVAEESEELLTPVTHGSNQTSAYMKFDFSSANEETDRVRIMLVADLPKCGRLKDAIAIANVFEANNQSIRH